jgi:rod shape-determining protein MreD
MYDMYGGTFSRFFAAMVPFGLAILGSVIANFPVSFTQGFLPAPLFGLMPVYFFGLMRPDLMPAGAALLAGAAEDLLSGGTPGIWAAGFVACYIFTDRQRDSLAGLASFGAILGFAAALMVAVTTAFAVVAVYYGRIPHLAPVAATLAANVLWYIPALWLMTGMQHNVVGPLRGDF